MKKIKYTDMAIWVDANIHNKTFDEEKAYRYLRNLAKMLSLKRRFFYTNKDYEHFADYIATIVYMRMTDKRQYLPENDPKKITTIKSCLNYMKGILYARKVAYSFEEFRQSTKETEEFSIARDFYEHEIDTANNDFLQLDLEIYLGNIHKLVWAELKKGVYAKDTNKLRKLHLSVLVTLLKNVTLSDKNKDKLSRRIVENEVNGKIIKVWQNNYDEVFAQILEEENVTSPTVIGLNERYVDYVSVVAQRIKQQMVKDINELIREYTVSDQMVEDMLMTNVGREEID